MKEAFQSVRRKLSSKSVGQSNTTTSDSSHNNNSNSNESPNSSEGRSIDQNQINMNMNRGRNTSPTTNTISGNTSRNGNDEGGIYNDDDMTPIDQQQNNNTNEMNTNLNIGTGGEYSSFHMANNTGENSPNNKVDSVARSDVSLPKREKRRSSIMRHQTIQSLKDLPHLKDIPMQKREALFQQKLQLCSVMFNFDDPMSDKRGKDLKRSTLLELVDYVNNPGGQKMFTEALMPDIFAMVTNNICRALPVQTEDFDPEEDEPVLEPSWPHLQVVYEFFLRFIVSSEVNTKVAKKYVTQKFCLQLTELFDSEDPRERDYLKTILHRIYGKFMSYRSFIRKAISNVFYRFVYETERHNGVGELLEILGSIINGFAIPLKKEHLQFLEKALIPLHKPKRITLYHQQLSYCITQYVEKEPDTAVTIIHGLIRYWPWSCSAKQLIFLNELEEILELINNEQIQKIYEPLFHALVQCLSSQHFQVNERALFLWNNVHLVNNGILSRQYAPLVLPIIYGPLYKNSLGHWNNTVESLAQNVLKLYMDYDVNVFDKCANEYLASEERKTKELSEKQKRWDRIEELVRQKQAATSSGVDGGNLMLQNNRDMKTETKEKENEQNMMGDRSPI